MKFPVPESKFSLFCIWVTMWMATGFAVIIGLISLVMLGTDGHVSLHGALFAVIFLLAFAWLCKRWIDKSPYVLRFPRDLFS